MLSFERERRLEKEKKVGIFLDLIHEKGKRENYIFTFVLIEIYFIIVDSSDARSIRWVCS